MCDLYLGSLCPSNMEDTAIATISSCVCTGNSQSKPKGNDMGSGFRMYVIFMDAVKNMALVYTSMKVSLMVVRGSFSLVVLKGSSRRR